MGSDFGTEDKYRLKIKIDIYPGPKYGVFQYKGHFKIIKKCSFWQKKLFFTITAFKKFVLNFSY